MKTVKRQRYSNEFKDRALTLVGLGRPVPEVAQELGIGTSILYRWTLAQRQGAQDAPSCAACARRTPSSSWRTTF